jgi:Tfp pilus assembly protein PilN
MNLIQKNGGIYSKNMNKSFKLKPTYRIVEETATEIKLLVISSLMNHVTILHSESFSKDQQKLEDIIPLYNKSTQPTALLFPLSHVIYIVVDFPDIEDEEELEQWTKMYFKNHCNENSSIIRYYHLLHEEHHQILILGYPQEKLEQLQKKIDFEKNNIVYVGTGLESLGYSVLSFLEDTNHPYYFSYSLIHKQILVQYYKGSITNLMELEKEQNYHDFVDKQSLVFDSSSGKNILQKKKDVLKEKYCAMLGVGINIAQSICPQVNFLSTKQITNNVVHLEKQKTKSYFIFGLLFILVFQILLSLISSLQLNRIKIMTAQREQYEDSIAKLEENEKELKTLESGLKLAKTTLHNKSDFSEVLEIVGKNIPKNVHLNGLVIEKESFLLEGISDSNQQVASYMDKLQKSFLIKNIDLLYIKPPRTAPQDGSEIRAFALSGTW